MMKYVLITICFLFTSLQTVAQDVELEVVTENWPPFIVAGEETIGVVTTKVKRILELSGISYSLRVYPWARSYHLATTKPNVLIYSIYRNPEREPLFHWFCPIHKSTPIHIYKLEGNDAKIDTLEELKTSVIGIMRGDHSHQFLKSRGFEEKVNLDLSATEETNVLKLVHGKVDAVSHSKESLRYRLDALGRSDLNFVQGLKLHQDSSTKHCMALSKGTDPKLIEKVSKALTQWQDENDNQ